MKKFDKLEGRTMEEISSDRELFNLYLQKYWPRRKPSKPKKFVDLISQLPY